MSYIREKTIKGNTYLYEQECFRDGDKVKTRHVKYIGKSGKLGTTNKNSCNVSITPSINENKIKKIFGYTDNPKEAGYVMKDGKMLDFSGRRQATGYKNGKVIKGQRDYLKDSHTVDHREISQVINSSKLSQSERKEFKDSRFFSVEHFGKKTGAIRFFLTNGSLNIQFFKKPTLKQIEQIERTKATEVFVDIDYKKQGTYKGEYSDVRKLRKDLLN